MIKLAKGYTMGKVEYIIISWAVIISVLIVITMVW